MELYIAKHGGFCFGVKQAVETALQVTEAQNTKRPIVTYGPLIHNQDVVKLLASRGASVVESLEGLEEATVVVRSHGVGQAFYKEASSRGIDVVDTTCVFVKKVHRIVNEHAARGYRIVICGDPKHPEIIGICGWAGSDYQVISTVEEGQAIYAASQLEEKPLCLVAQTTLNQKKWTDLVEVFKTYPGQVEIFNTICSSTRLRQDEVVEISKKVDFVLVVGGRESSNTQKLYEIAKKQGKNAQHIENVDEINVNLLKKYDKIGIVAGASTPDWVIQEVIQKLKSEGEVVVNGRQ